jgi:hypothetical protein
MHEHATCGRDPFLMQALHWSRLSQNPFCQVETLRGLALAAFYEGDQGQAMLAILEEAEPLLSQTSPLIESSIRSMQAVAAARQGKEALALAYLQQAEDAFPSRVEADPGVAYRGDYHRPSLILWTGRVYAALAEHQGTRQTSYGQRARDSLEALLFLRSEHVPGTFPERVRLEVLTTLAEITMLQGDLEAFRSFLLQAMQGAGSLGSRKRWQETLALYRRVRAEDHPWHNERSLVELADLFINR